MNEKAPLLRGTKKVTYKQLSIDESTTSVDNVRSNGANEGWSCKKPVQIEILFMRIIVLVAFSLLIIPASVPLMKPSVHQQQQQQHDHIMPTLFAIRTIGGEYVNALENPLYEEMKYATFNSFPDTNSKPYPNLKSIKSPEDNRRLEVDKDQIRFHDSLSISWKDVIKASGESPDAQDVIAIYCPAGQHDPKKFVEAATISQIQSTSMGENQSQSDGFMNGYWSIPSFPIVREDTCEFKLWARSKNVIASTTFTLAARSDIVKIHHGLIAPSTIHLGLTENHDEMRVSFSTGRNRDLVPVVAYGDNDINLDHAIFIIGNSTTYDASNMCQSPANVEEPGKFVSPGLLHTATMSNLVSDTIYYYKVGLMSLDDAKSRQKEVVDEVVWSDVYHFHSPLRPGEHVTGTGDPLKYVVYADQGIAGYGGNDDGDRVAHLADREIKTHGIRAVHHFGDLSYAQGAGHMWDQWLDIVSVFSSKVPLMIGVGNHEYDHDGGGDNNKDPSGVRSAGGYRKNRDSGGECGVPTSKRFTMPANGNGVYWYSYDYGLAHTIMISTEHDLTPHSKQYQWLLRDLSLLNRTLTPWVIIEAHRPMYMIEDNPSETLVGIELKENIESLLKTHNVDLFLSGHYHAYFRSCSGLYKNKCNNGGLTHITVGTAGAQLDSWPLLRRPWGAFYTADWGYGRITIVNATELYFEFVSDEDGSTRDSTWIHR